MMPTEEESGGLEAAPRVALPSFLAGVLLMAVRGEICFLFYLPTLALVVSWPLWLSFTQGLLWRRGRPRLDSPMASLRAVWVAPLAYSAGHIALAMGGLLLPTRLGFRDVWPRWTGLPPEHLAPLGLTLFLQLLVATLLLSIYLAGHYIVAFARKGEVARERMAVPVVVVLTVALVALITRIQGAEAGRFGHVRAHLVWKSGQSERALGLLRELYRDARDGELADSALYRMGRIHAEELAQPDHAAGLFERLLSEYPGSPWADDATWRLARIKAFQNQPEEAWPLLRELPRRYPGSPHEGRAGLLLAESLLDHGRAAEARAVLEELTGTTGVLRLKDRYPFEIVPVARLARERLAKLAALRPG